MNSQQPIHFSDHFNIDKQMLNELGVFDPILNYDTKVFVEPLLLKSSSNLIIKNSYQAYRKFFADLLLLLQKSEKTGDKCWRVAKRMVNFPEYQYTCIGYSHGNTGGRGSGIEFNDKILQSAKEIVDLANGNPDIFLLLPLLEEGIAGDRISDMVQHIIDEDICRYTNEIMSKIGIEGDCRHSTRNFKSYMFLANPYSKLPIKLVPRDILLNLPVADSIDALVEEMATFNQQLRHVVNRDIGDIWIDTTKSYRKSVLLKELKTNKEFFIETLKALKEYRLDHYDLDTDYEGLYKWLANSQYFIHVELSKEIRNCPDNLESLAFAINTIIQHLRDTIENKEVWRTFWTQYGSEYRHVRVFYSQMLFFTVCNAWLTSQGSNIKIKLLHTAQQTNLEFSISDKNRLIVHVKHANNTSLLNHYNSILEQKRIFDHERHYYLVMNFKEEGAKQLKDVRIIENPICKLFEIMVTNQDTKAKNGLLKPPNVSCDTPEFIFNDEVLAFEGIDLRNVPESQSKGGKARHRNTTIIKTMVIKPIFLYKQKSSKSIKVSTISNAIVQELNSLGGHNDNSSKVQGFMSKYSINDYQHIKITIEYLQKNNDGGQISEWCYQISQEKI